MNKYLLFNLWFDLKNNIKNLITKCLIIFFSFFFVCSFVPNNKNRFHKRMPNSFNWFCLNANSKLFNFFLIRPDFEYLFVKKKSKST